MPSNIDLDELFAWSDGEEDSFQREERCRKALKTVGKAIIMRLFVTVLLVFIVFTVGIDLMVTLLLLLVMVINLGGCFPLIGEWKSRRNELNRILDEE